ncbi:hypothetical protein BJ138DRAFT_1186992 [Hygrophoropsis aurantiaca]|uniref:Uncharacterized protein n=1 Tax=Hygrophoropsis aurantiaca TaxID=72124 RepID=A0ACB8AC67_9AGAM|nr:hypothetical protein BJ138DRAFT_1186992 [Hygrophoropsis aurantiaca]
MNDHDQRLSAASSDLLASLLHSHPTSIEILPGDASLWAHQPSPADAIDAGSSTYPFLFIENNLGIPQKVLYSTYILAVQRFTQCKKRDLAVASRSAILELKSTSAIIILANPAHHTALNARRRLVLCAYSYPADTHDPSEDAGCLRAEDELAFTAALLSSRHCAKEAGLWSYRRWLMQRIYPSESDACAACSISCDRFLALRIPPDVLRTELRIVTRACELYPRNYFAWMHRSICMQGVLHHIAALHRPHSPNPDDKEAHVHDEYLDIITAEISTTKRWIEQHVADASAVHYLVTLVHSVQSHSSYVSNQELPSGNLSLASHAMSLLRAFPVHEALWAYIRGAVVVERSGTAFVELSSAFSGSSTVFAEARAPGEDKDKYALLDSVRAFAFEKVLTPIGDANDSEYQVVAVHAARFIEWLRRTGTNG